MFENETRLYKRFLTFSNVYGLVPPNLVIIPADET